MRTIAILILSCLLLVPLSHAQQRYPTKTVRLVVPFAFGGGSDTLGRLLASRLEPRLGQEVVVDNRGGSNGMVGTQLVRRAAPDGYTLLLGTVRTLSINPVVYPQMRFDASTAFAPISLVGVAPAMLVVNPGWPVKNLEGLIEYARARPGELAFASTGTGSLQHLAGELLKLQARIDLLHVPYKDLGQGLADLVAGRVAVIVANIHSVLPLVQAGRLKALAVTRRVRSPIVPHLPTAIEAGLSEFEVAIWHGVLAPARTPRTIVVRLNEELNAVLALPELRARWTSMGVEATSSTPEAFVQRMQADQAKWERVLKLSAAPSS